MKIDIQPGRYVVAVSGGVDSIVLLDMLTQQPDLELVVAHLDHGIRVDSAADAVFVKSLTKKYHLPFYGKRVELGSEASENEARRARYGFLDEIKKQTEARAIITAHHQDDVIETAVLNMLRGTKRKGLVSLQSTDEIIRPLLGSSKQELVTYAQQHELTWREDSTNQDVRYKRNEVRKMLSENLAPVKRQQILTQLEKIKNQDDQIELLTSTILAAQPDQGLSRALLADMDETVAYEIVASWLRAQSVGFDRKTLERVVNGNRDLQTGAQIDLQANFYCLLQKQQIVLMQRDSV